LMLSFLICKILDDMPATMLLGFLSFVLVNSSK